MISSKTPMASVRGLRFIEGANLKDVGIIPALAQSRVREDEAQRHARVEQTLLVPHDEVIGVLVIGTVAARVLGVALLVL